MKPETDTAATETTNIETAPPAPKPQQSATVTLRAADGSTMQIVAERRADGARTYVITTGPDKKAARGMTAQHASFEAAKASTAASATKAEKLGWVRKQAARGFVAKPDAFSTLPAAPKGKKS